MNSDIKNEVKGAAESIIGEIISVRREIHRNPSLSEKEQPTVELLSKILAENGIPHEKLLNGTAICAVIGTGSEPCVGIRADIDALPIKEESGLDFSSEVDGVMHACGHDIHASVALGASIVLKKIERHLNGTVKIFFQPAEETIGGAARMIAAGVTENPKVTNVIGLHCDPALEAGKMNYKYGAMYATSDMFDIIVHGKGCHGAHPDEGIDPIAISAAIITSLQTVVSRTVSPTEPAVVTVGRINAGFARNVIPDEAEMSGIIRTMSRESREKLRERVREIAEDTAAALGGSAEFILTPSYTCLVNADEAVDVVKNAATEIFGEGNAIETRNVTLGTEDFAYFAEAAPSCFWHLGCGFAGKENASIHNASFIANEACILPAIKTQVLSSIALLDRRNEK